MRRLGTIDVCGIPYAVQAATPDEDSGLDEVDGYMKFSARRIVISEGLGPERTREVFLHEALHALWAEAGLSHVINLSGGPTPDSGAAVALEETLIRVLTPGLVRMLDSMKNLKGTK